MLWLIGKTQNKFKKTKLPSKRDVLSLYFHRCYELKDTESDAANHVSEKTIAFWKSLCLPTKRKDGVKSLILKLVSAYRNLKKNKSLVESNEKMNIKVKNFESTLDYLFDISPTDVIIENEDIKNFYLSQKEPNKLKHVKEISHIAKNIKDRQKDRKKENRHSVDNNDGSEIPLSQNSNSSAPGDNDFVPEEIANENRKKKIKISGPLLTSTLDRIKLSSSDASLIIPVLAQSLGQDANNIVCSEATVRRLRKEDRRKSFERIKYNFLPIEPLTMHWDSKLMKSTRSESRTGMTFFFFFQILF